MFSNGMYDEERFDMNLADEGKAYNDGYENGIKDILRNLYCEIEKEKGCGIIYSDFNYGLDTALNKITTLAEKYCVEINE